MAHHKSALKRIRTSRKARERNRQYRSTMRTSLRRAAESNDENRVDNIRKACSILDRLVSKGIIHKNTAARRKSKLYHVAPQQ